MFNKDLFLSIRGASSKLELSPTTVHRMLHENLFLFPYKRQLFKTSKRVTSKNDWTLQIIALHAHTSTLNTYSKSWFFDEWMFWISGVAKKQDTGIWRTDRPEEHNKVVFISPSVLKRCCVSNERIIRPYFFAWERYWWNLRKDANSTCVSKAKIFDRRLRFSARWCFSTLFKPSHHVYDQ